MLETQPVTHTGDSYQDANYEHLQLENQKLRFEIGQLTKPKSWTDRVEKFLPVLTALIAVAGFWFGVYQFHQQEKNIAANMARQQQERLANFQNELKRASDSKELELRKPFWEKQLEYYFAASAAAATIATSKEPQTVKKAKAKFWDLYWGPLAIVEDAGMKKPEDAVVEGAMVLFGNCFDGTDVCNEQEIKQRSLSLAHKCRASVGKSWEVKFADLDNKK